MEQQNNESNSQRENALKQQRSSFRVMYLIQRGKQKANGKVSILARITVNGGRVHLSTKIEILPERWLAKEYRTIGTTKEEKIINQNLEDFKVILKQRYMELLNSGKPVTANKLKQSVLCMDDKTNQYVELCDDFISDYRKLTEAKKYGRDSLNRYILLRERLAEFIKEKYKVADIPLVDINKQFLMRFYLWLCQEKMLANNTAIKFIRCSSTIYKTALDNGWVQSNPFRTLNLSQDKTDRGYLTKSELSHLIQKDFKSQRLELIRDLFVFSCYTGLAYVDVAKLTNDMIEERADGSLWISTNRQKTGTPVNVPLLDMPQLIIGKYREEMEQINTLASRRNASRARRQCLKLEDADKLLPVPSNQKVNDYLKEIATLCGIDKDLTFHMARHTFATTITLSNGVPIESVSKMLGHTNIKTTQIYARITDQKVAQDMNILAQKLNQASV